MYRIFRYAPMQTINTSNATTGRLGLVPFPFFAADADADTDTDTEAADTETKVSATSLGYRSLFPFPPPPPPTPTPTPRLKSRLQVPATSPAYNARLRKPSYSNLLFLNASRISVASL